MFIITIFKFNYTTTLRFKGCNFPTRSKLLPALVGLGLTIVLAILFSALVTNVACCAGAGWIWI